MGAKRAAENASSISANAFDDFQSTGLIGYDVPSKNRTRREGVAEFLRFDADGGERGRLSRIWRLVAARVVDGCRVRDFGWWLDRFGGCPGPRYYQCPTYHPPVPCDRGACARRASVSSCRDRRACSLYSRGVGHRMVS